MKPQDHDLKFIDGPAQPDAASRKSLNNQPAWMTRGLGVNTEIFGESKGNLIKPGMYEEDLERIEAMKGNPLGDGPDPFGDVFAERKSVAVSTSTPVGHSPLPSQAEQFVGGPLPARPS